MRTVSVPNQPPSRVRRVGHSSRSPARVGASPREGDSGLSRQTVRGTAVLRLRRVLLYYAARRQMWLRVPSEATEGPSMQEDWLPRVLRPAHRPHTSIGFGLDARGSSGVPTRGIMMVRRFSDHRHLLTGAGWLVAQTIAAAAGGFVFWLAAARLYPQEAVGAAAALFALVQLVNYATSLGLPISLGRYAADESPASARKFSAAVLATIASSIVGTIVLLVLAKSGTLEPLWVWGLPLGSLLFFASVAGLSVAVLIDVRLLALRRAGWVLGRTIVLSGLRLTLLIAPVALLGSQGAFPVWLAVVASTAVVSGISLWWLRQPLGFPDLSAPVSDWAAMTRFSAVNYASQLVVQAPFILLPVIVLSAVSPSENAVFFVAWSIAAVVFMVPRTIGRVLLIEGDRGTAALESQTALALLLSVGSALLAAILLPLSSVLMSALYGSQYRDAADLMVPLLLSAVPWAVTSVMLSEARVREDHLATGIISGSFAVVVVTASAVGVAAGDALGASRGWLFGTVIVGALSTVVIIVRHRRGLLLIAASDTAGLRLGEKPDRLPVLMVAIGMLVICWLMAGAAGLIAAVAVLGATAMGIRWLAPVSALILVGGAAMATVLEAPLEQGLGYATQRPIANALAMMAMVVALAGALTAAFQEGRWRRPRADWPRSDSPESTELAVEGPEPLEPAEDRAQRVGGRQLHDEALLAEMASLHEVVADVVQLADAPVDERPEPETHGSEVQRGRSERRDDRPAPHPPVDPQLPLEGTEEEDALRTWGLRALSWLALLVFAMLFAGSAIDDPQAQVADSLRAGYGLVVWEGSLQIPYAEAPLAALVAAFWPVSPATTASVCWATGSAGLVNLVASAGDVLMAAAVALVLPVTLLVSGVRLDVGLAQLFVFGAVLAVAQDGPVTRSLVAGGLLGAAVLARPEAMILLAALVGVVALRHSSGCWARIAALLAGAVLVLLPWQMWVLREVDHSSDVADGSWATVSWLLPWILLSAWGLVSANGRHAFNVGRTQ